MSSFPIVLAITGASGVTYGRRLLEALLLSDIDVHLVISKSGKSVIKHELGIDLERGDLLISPTKSDRPISATAEIFDCDDFMAPIASGSFKTRGMVVCPCSGATLSGIATAASRNLIQRAAEVHLKERRPLILVPRETPLSLIQIDNMRTACQAGATILPASPGFYQGPPSVEGLVDFVVSRILDQFDIEHSFVRRWGEPAPGSGELIVNDKKKDA